jgi:phosphoribosylformylglycinamidine (FGAM) synthase-like enzyme
VRLLGVEPEHPRLRAAVGASTAPYGKPERIASALDIMIEGPIGAAAFNNEFGRPNLAGYFRTFEQDVAGDGHRARLPQADHDRRRRRQHRRARSFKIEPSRPARC